VGTLEEENAKLELQRQYFASDDHIKRRAEPYRDQTPEQGLADVSACCEMAQWFLEHRPEGTRDLPPEPLPVDTIEILERLQRR